MTRRSVASLILFTLSAAACLGCDVQDDAVDAAARNTAVSAVSPAEIREVVRATGWDGRRALSTLTNFEALAAEAEARGMGASATVVSETRRAAVRAFVRREVAEAVNAGDVPAAMVDAAYKAAEAEFMHGEKRRAAHVLCRVDAQPEDIGTLTEGQADALMAEVAADARVALRDLVDSESSLSKAPLSEARLRAWVARYASKRFAIGHGLVESTSETDGGAACVLHAEVLSATEADGGFVRPFLDALFALPASPGALSPPVRTSFGVHVILLAEVIEARQVDRQAADAELRQRLLPRVRAARLAEILEAAKRQYPIDSLGRDLATRLATLEFEFDER